MRVARGERKFIRLRRDDARAAVRPAQFARRFQDRQIAAHGRDRGFDVLGEFFQRREFHALKIGFNAVFAFVGGHGFKFKNFTDEKIIARYSSFFQLHLNHTQILYHNAKATQMRDLV